MGWGGGELTRVIENPIVPLGDRLITLPVELSPSIIEVLLIDRPRLVSIIGSKNDVNEGKELVLSDLTERPIAVGEES